MVYNKQIVGGIGVSGATSAQDLEVANGAVSVFETLGVHINNSNRGIIGKTKTAIKSSISIEIAEEHAVLLRFLRLK